MKDEEGQEVSAAALTPKHVHRAALTGAFGLGVVSAPAATRHRLGDRSGELLGHPPTIGALDGRWRRLGLLGRRVVLARGGLGERLVHISAHQDLLRDDEALDLRGALVELHDLRVAH